MKLRTSTIASGITLIAAGAVGGMVAIAIANSGHEPSAPQQVRIVEQTIDPTSEPTPTAAPAPTMGSTATPSQASNPQPPASSPRATASKDASTVR